MEEIKDDIEKAKEEFEEFQKTFEKQKNKKIKNKKGAHAVLTKQKDQEEMQILKDMESVEREHNGAREEIDKLAEIRIEKLRTEQEQKLVEIQEAVQTANCKPANF